MYLEFLVLEEDILKEFNRLENALKNVRINKTSIKPIIPFFVSSAILCSIIIELSTMISPFIFLLISLKFSDLAKLHKKVHFLAIQNAYRAEIAEHKFRYKKCKSYDK